MIIRGESAGTWSIEGRSIVLRDKTGNVHKYWIVDFKRLPDGKTLMHTLSSSWEPTPDNLYWFTEAWLRP